MSQEVAGGGGGVQKKTQIKIVQNSLKMNLKIRKNGKTEKRKNGKRKNGKRKNGKTEKRKGKGEGEV